MRVLFLGNNWLGWQVLRWLRHQNETVVGLVVNAPKRAKHRAEIVQTSGLSAGQIFSGETLRQTTVLAAIRELNAEIAVSVMFGHILQPEIFQLFANGCINLHPSFLPYNRGAHPNVWSLVDGTPAGVTLHYIDAGVDTGDIIAQREVPVAPIDTGETLYRRLELASLELFTDTWPAVCAGRAARRKQPLTGGTCHRTCDLQQLDDIDLEAPYKARDLINLLRARTFPPYPGAYFRDGERKVHLRLELSYDTTVGEER